MCLNRFLAFLFVLALSTSVEAEQAKKVFLIGFLSSQSQSRSAERADAFRQGLRELGYLEGKNIIIEYRWANGIADRLPELAAELLRLKVDIIVTSGGVQATIAAKNATSSIPIVTGGGDVVTAELVNSLSHPGGNVTGVTIGGPEVTGVTIGGPEVSGKRLEILKDVVPKLSRVAYISNPTAGAGATSNSREEIGRAAEGLRLQLQLHEGKHAYEIVAAFDAMAKERANALLVAQSPPISSDYKRILDLTAKYRLPAMYYDSSWPTAGGLMSYGTSVTDQHRRVALYVDKILKGAKPADLPVEQPRKFEFIINLKAAKQIGLNISPNVLARADKVIK